MPAATSKKKRIYKVIFTNHGQIYEIYAKRVGQGNLFGFVEVEGLIFGERTSVVVVEPSEESLQREFSGVGRTYIPMHTVVRIDEVEKRGSSKIHAVPESSDKVTPRPTPIYTLTKTDG